VMFDIGRYQASGILGDSSAPHRVDDLVTMELFSVPDRLVIVSTICSFSVSARALPGPMNPDQFDEAALSESRSACKCGPCLFENVRGCRRK